MCVKQADSRAGTGERTAHAHHTEGPQAPELCDGLSRRCCAHSRNCRSAVRIVSTGRAVRPGVSAGLPVPHRETSHALRICLTRTREGLTFVCGVARGAPPTVGRHIERRVRATPALVIRRAAPLSEVAPRPVHRGPPLGVLPRPDPLVRAAGPPEISTGSMTATTAFEPLRTGDVEQRRTPHTTGSPLPESEPGRRFVVIGSDVARKVCGSLQAAGHDVHHLTQPTDDDLRRALKEEVAGVAILLDDDVESLRYALAVEHIRPTSSWSSPSSTGPSPSNSYVWSPIAR